MAPIYEVSYKVSEKESKVMETFGIGKRRSDLEDLGKLKIETLKVEAPIPQTAKPTIQQVAELDTSNWIIIPADFVEGKYGDGDIIIDPARLTYGPAIERVAKELDLDLRNTATDSLDRDFIGCIKWQPAMNLNLATGNETPGLILANDFLRFLNQGIRGDVKVHTQTKRLDNKDVESIYLDIVGVKSPWRAEWYDTAFEEENRIFYVLTQDKNKREKLVGGLREDRTISLEAWTENPTKQGLPRANIKEGNLYYRVHRDGSVAGFVASSDGAGLGCGRVPAGRDSNRGVRAAKQLK